MIRYNEPIKKYEIIGVCDEKIEVLDTVYTYVSAVYTSEQYEKELGPAWEIYFHEL